jgi:DNA-binding response OmpR family regulator
MSPRAFEHLIPVDLDFQCENARIMVIDDEPVMTLFVSKTLNKAGFENILAINNPHAALDEISRFQPDLILLDIVMPELSGLELLDSIRSDERFRDVTVLMLSAADKKSKYRALNLGAVDFINKPVDADDLEIRVRKALRVI